MEPENRQSQNYRSYASKVPYVRPRTESSHQAAANIARTQLGSIYANDPSHNITQSPTSSTQVPPHQPSQTNTAPAPATSNPSQPSAQATSTPASDANSSGSGVYDRTLSDHQPKVDPEAWKKYHSSWQNYYQQYFYRYYVTQIQQSQLTLSEQTAKIKQYEELANQKTPEEALTDLRSKLRHTVSQKATEVRKSRHFRPIMAALVVMFMFVAIQYNSVAFAAYYAYIAPSSAEPVNIIVDPTENIDVGPEPRLIIPKINVDVPVIWDTTPDHDAQMKAMEKGVAWFGIAGANSKPGQVGNTVLSGHSSNDWIESGDYKFIFARLDRLNKGDTFYINYQSERYVYTVTKKRVVMPNNVGALTYETSKPEVTLITCTPLGTADKRLLVTAEQVSPSPNKSQAAPSRSDNEEPAKMPGKGDTLFEKLFGG